MADVLDVSDVVGQIELLAAVEPASLWGRAWNAAGVHRWFGAIGATASWRAAYNPTGGE